MFINIIIDVFNKTYEFNDFSSHRIAKELLMISLFLLRFLHQNVLVLNSHFYTASSEKTKFSLKSTIQIYRLKYWKIKSRYLCYIKIYQLLEQLQNLKCKRSQEIIFQYIFNFERKNLQSINQKIWCFLVIIFALC